MNTAVFVLNRTSSSSLKDKSPYETWFGKKPLLDNFRVFGTGVFTHVLKVLRHWMLKAKTTFLLGIQMKLNGVVLSRDIIFKVPSFAK